MEIKAADVKALRDKTGAGMMECKKALTECNGDEEAAIKLLKEKGLAALEKRAERATKEGRIFIKLEGSKLVIAELTCETDFVAKGEKFQALVNDSAKQTLAKGYKTIEEAKTGCAQLYTDATVSMGEKLDYRRFEIVSKASGNGFGSYLHMGGKIATLVVVEKADEELAKGLAMHIAANAPKYVEESDIPASEIAHEKAIALETMKNDPKLAKGNHKKTKSSDSTDRSIPIPANKSINALEIEEMNFIVSDYKIRLKNRLFKDIQKSSICLQSL